MSDEVVDSREEAIKIAEEMLLDNPTDYGRIQSETGLALKVIYGIKGKLRKENRLPLEKKADEANIKADVKDGEGIVAAEEQMFAEMRSVLIEELDITPGIASTGKSKDYILNRFDSEKVYKTNPTELYFLISKVSPKVEDWNVREIVTRVFNVTRSYNLDRMKLGAAMPRTWYQEAGMPYIQLPQQRGYGGYDQGQYGQNQYPNYYTKEQVDEMIRRRDEKSNLDRLAEMVGRLADKVDKMSSGGVASQGIIERTYVDSNGKQVTERVLPSGQTSTLDELVKLKQAGLLGKDIDLEDVRRVVREEVPPTPEEPPAIVEMKMKLAENERRYEELKDKISEADKKALLDEIKSLRDEVRSRTGIGWQSDEGRIIGEAASAIARKEPVKVVVDLLGKEKAPKEKLVEEKASEGLLSRLSKEHVIER